MKGKILKLCAFFALISIVVGCGESNPEASSAADNNTARAVETAPMVVADFHVGALPVAGNCSLDAVDGKAASAADLTVGKTVVFGGWVGDATGKTPAAAQLVLSGSNNTYAVPVSPSVARPDVATALGQPGLASSGFNITTTLSLDPGTYDVFVVIDGEEPTACSMATALKIH